MGRKQGGVLFLEWRVWEASQLGEGEGPCPEPLRKPQVLGGKQLRGRSLGPSWPFPRTENCTLDRTSDFGTGLQQVDNKGKI